MKFPSVFFKALRNIGNDPIINGIGTSNKSLSAIVMFTALYIGYGQYVKQEDFAQERFYVKSEEDEYGR